MKVLCSGDRGWTDEALVRSVLARLPKDTVVIHGDNGDDLETAQREGRPPRGLDRIAGRVAESLGFVVIAHPAEWHRYGKIAGPMRNKQMMDEEPDQVFAWHDDLSHSKGTADMVKRALRRRVPVTLFTHEFPEGRLIERMTARPARR